MNLFSRTVSNDGTPFDDQSRRQIDDFIEHLKRRLNTLKENQRTVNDEIEENQMLGSKLLKLLECHGETNEIEKYKLFINEVDTITSILLKLSCRLAKIENDLLSIPENDSSQKAALLERREQAQQKHDEAKTLKDGIDRRNRLVTNILKKYFNVEQFEDFEHFIRMKSTLSMDAKDLEEHIQRIEKQIDILTKICRSFPSNVNRESRFQPALGNFQTFDSSIHDENLSKSSFKSISTIA